MEESNSAPSSASKKSRLRSPAYPGVDLFNAIRRLKVLYNHERRNSTPVNVAVGHWGFKPSSGGGFIVIAALKSFGLLVEQGSGPTRTIRASDLGLRIILDEREESKERFDAIKTAALNPKIHADLWKKYGPEIPSDGNLRHYLIFELKFNENTVDDFIKEYRNTIRFAQLTNSDTIADEIEDKVDQDREEQSDSDEDPPLLEIGNYIQWESGGVLQFEQRRVTGLSDDGEYVFVEGTKTGLPIKEVTVVEAPILEVKQQRNTTPEPRPATAWTPAPPSLRSYAFPLSGEFNAKLDLFGEAETEEDLDALADYVELTVKALKRSLKARINEKAEKAQ
jgi:hypothetical protein